MYCLKCKKKVATVNPPASVVSANGRPAIKAECADCGTKLYQFVKKV